MNALLNQHRLKNAERGRPIRFFTYLTTRHEEEGTLLGNNSEKEAGKMLKPIYPSNRRIREIPEGTQCCQCGEKIYGEPEQFVIMLDESRILCLGCSTRRQEAMESLGCVSGL